MRHTPAPSGAWRPCNPTFRPPPRPVRPRARLLGTPLLLLSLLLAAGCSDPAEDDDSSETSPTPPHIGQAQIEVDASALDFGEVLLDDEATRDLTVRNTGTAVLTVTAAITESAQDQYVIESSSEPFDVAPDSTATVTVRFAPVVDDSHAGLLQLTSNDESSPLVEVSLTGVGVIADNDLDGWPDETDCDDEDPEIHPEAPETCDGLDNDCDDQIDEEVTTPFYADQDGDGFGDLEAPTSACVQPDGHVTDSTDCDDSSSTSFPGATEVCDERDNDCDDQIDEEAADVATWYPDGDGDGYGIDGDTVTGCARPEGYAASSHDCDDADPRYNPGASESDCTDANDYNCDGSTGYADADADGHPACQDCDDSNPAAHPGAEEVCDGADNDCDGTSDEEVTATFYADTDGDTFGNAALSQTACTAPDGYVSDNTDCNDQNRQVNPAAVETCNGKDDDCDAEIDEIDAQGCTVLYADGDGDTWGGDTSACLCELELGYTSKSGDCSDTDPRVNPGATETCNGKDDDCDGTTDEENAQGCSIYHNDADVDGWGATTDTKCLCQATDTYTASSSTDCDDHDPQRYPGNLELCDEKDNNCNGQVDEGVKLTWYIDADSDGFGAAYNSKEACTAPAGYVGQGGDCNDYNVAISPAAAEVCDKIDNNCNGQADEGLAQVTVYVDLDGDGDGAAGTTGTKTCLIDEDGDGTGEAAPAGYALTNTDCVDSDVTVHAGAAELCDQKDNDCDTVVDKLCFTACGGQWPFKQDYVLGTPDRLTVTDLNGDGKFEVIVQDNFGFAITDYNGVPHYNYSAESHNYSRNRVVLADIDGYDTFGAGTQTLEVLTGDGSVPRFYRLNGDKTVTTFVNSSVQIYDASPFMASDLDFDGKVEFLTTAWNAGEGIKMFRFDKSSSQISLVNTLPDPDNSYQYTDGRTLTDLDGDGVAELVFGNGYAYATIPSYWAGNLYAYALTNASTLAFEPFCEPGACFDTTIEGLHSGAVGSLYRIGDSINVYGAYFSTAVPNQSNPSVGYYWAYDLDGQPEEGSPSSSAPAFYPTDVDRDGRLESVTEVAELGLWDVNGDGYPDRLYTSGTELRVALWDKTKQNFVEHTPSRLSISGAGIYMGGVWDTDGDGRLNVISSDSGGNVYCHELGPATWNRASSLPPHITPYLRTYQWDNFEPNDGADLNADELPDRVVRVASALTRQGNFYSYLSDMLDQDYFMIDAGWSGPICLTSPKGLKYRLKIYSYSDRWNNVTREPTPDGKKDGLIWSAETSAGGQTCFYASSVTPYRNGEYRFVAGIEPVDGASLYWPYWISAPK